MAIKTSIRDMIRSPLTRRMTAVVFATILLVEIAILLPSYANREQELLDNLHVTGSNWAIAVTGNLSKDAKSEQIANAVFQSEKVTGVLVVREAGIEHKIGETFTGRLTPSKNIRSDDGSRYEIHFTSKTGGQPYVLHLRLDSSHIEGELTAFVLRIAGLILIISLTLTAATIIAMGHVVLGPLVRLKEALDRGSFSLDQETAREATRKDEIGDVYRATSAMLEQVQASNSYLESVVEDRTRDLQNLNEELGRQADLLEETISNIHQGIVVYDGDLNMIACNENFARMRNLPVEFLEERPSLEDIFRYQAQQGFFYDIEGDVEQQVAFLMQTTLNKSLIEPWEQTRPDGTIHEVRTIHLADGGIVRTFSDITERKRIEESQRALLDSIALPVFVLSDEDQYVYLNEHAATIMGCAVNDLVGASVKSIFVDLEDRENLLSILKMEGRVDDFEARIHLPNDQTGWGMFSTRPLKFQGVSAHMSLVTNITDRKEAEETLRQREELLRTLFETTSFGIVQQPPVGQGRLSVNQAFCEMTGYTESELLAIPFLSVTHPDDTGRATDWRKKFVDGTSSIDVDEYRIVTKFGAEKWVNRTVTAIHSPDGTVERLVSFVQDATERKRAEQAIVEAKEAADAANRAKSDLVATVSHEVRTPMNGVLGMARLLRDTPLNDDQSDSVETVISSAESLLRIVNDLLDMSKLEAGHLELEHIPFVGADTVSQAISIMMPRADEKGLALISKIDPSLPDVVIGDPHRLRQVMMNLISNAVKFTRTGSISVELSLIDSDEATAVLEFAVSDTGAGIKREHQAKLFAPYSQGAADIARRYGGTGLGLAICRRLVGLMGGDIALASELGDGSRFSFQLSLPIARDVKAASLRHDRNSSLSRKIETAQLKPLKILQVEDNATNRKVLEQLLQRAGHSISSVEHGGQALDALSMESFDLIFMDRHMPEIDGLEATRRIRAMAEPMGTVPIIGITAGALEDELVACLDAGMNVVLTKPVDETELFKTLESIMEKGSVPDFLSLEHPVLVVDDVAVNLAVAQKQLTRLGIQSDITLDSHEALQKLLNGTYSAALVDMEMPGLSGIDLVRQYRQQTADTSERLPIIAMTGNVAVDDMAKCKEAGMDGFVMKPVAIEVLQKALLDVVRATNVLKQDVPNVIYDKVPEVVAVPVDLSGLSSILGIDDHAELMEMLTLFVDTFPDLMTPLDEAVSGRDPVQLHNAAHAAKSAAANAAAVPMSALLGQLEKDAVRQEWDGLLALHHQVSVEFDRVTEFVRDRQLDT